MLQGNPRFEPASFAGRGAVNGTPIFLNQLPVTGGGVIGELPADTPFAPFGRLVSLKPETENTLILGAGDCPIGVLIADPAIMQNDPAMNKGYFSGRPATYIIFGEVQYKEYAIAAGLKPPSIGGKVLANDVTGEIGFVDFNDSIPTGFSQLRGIVVKSNEPNGATVFFGVPSLIINGTGVDVTAVAETPTASPAAGAVATGTAVTLSTATDGAVIYYTLDGTNPTNDSAVYDSPIIITAAVTIKAIAVKSGMGVSAAASFAYTIG
jgi:hypothetical protein